MASAIVGGVLKAGLYRAADIIAGEIDPGRREQVSSEYGITTVERNLEAAAAAPVLVLAVKPQNLPQVSEDLRGQMPHDPLVLSILAGCSIEKLHTYLGVGLPVVRAMPNLPAQIGKGISALASSEEVSPEQLNLARSIFSTVGEILSIPETLMDSVTALSASGPGFVYRLMEAFASAGERLGLPKATAQRLTLHTFIGAASLLSESGQTPAELREKVSSPGGTTAAGLEVMKQERIDNLIRQVLARAHDRARELGE